MTHHPDHRLHPIRILHILGCLALAVWFGWYGWTHHPARTAYRISSRVGPSSPKRRTAGQPLALPGEIAKRLGLVRSILPDVLAGAGVLLLFTLGTGIYARQFEIWLEAHQAGAAGALRGLGLDQAALGANKDRKKGATL